MTRSTKLSLLSRAAVLGLGLATSACITPVARYDGQYTTPIGSAPVTDNPTPYTKALTCLGQHAKLNNIPRPRVAVGRISDYTGKAELEGGRKVTQGASLMAISALAKAGMRLTERFDTSVAELELKYANNKLVEGDAANEAFRTIKAGSITGSDYYLVGGSTELNFNIRSQGLDVFGGDVDELDPTGNFNAKLFVMNVGLDLRLVDTKTLDVVDVISFQKQIIGREIAAGYFDFFNNNVIDIGVGEKALEPIQLAVRSVIERAALEMTANLYGVTGPEICDFDDPLATVGTTGDYTAFYPQTLETNNGSTREDSHRWRERRDDAVRAWLGGAD